MNTAATEIESTCDWCGAMHPLNDNVFCDKPIPVPKDDGVCYEFTHVPHVWAECRSCIEWCVNPDA